jgi:hypothetical protein
METIDINKIEYSTIKVPKYTWRCQLHPGTYWSVEDHRVPNRFHRWMQKLCFGVVWEKIDG